MEINSKSDNWSGVRPVRFSEEIFAVLTKVVEQKKISIISIKEILEDCREKREKRRLRGIRSKQSTKDSSRKKEKFLTKAEQFVRVLRRIELIKTTGDVIEPCGDSEKIVDFLKDGKNLEAKTCFLEVLLNSKFESYVLFLKRLTKSPIFIPKQFSKRDKTSSEYLSKIGVFLDSWSFYIIRDLFYDFGLLNYIVDKEGEKIFAVCEFDGKKQYTQKIKTPLGILHYWRKITLQQFMDQISKVYLSLTENNWDRFC